MPVIESPEIIIRPLNIESDNETSNIEINNKINILKIRSIILLAYSKFIFFKNPTLIEII